MLLKRINIKNKEEEKTHHTKIDGDFLFSSSTEDPLDNNWYLDLGATMHMTYEIRNFQ